MIFLDFGIEKAVVHNIKYIAVQHILFFIPFYVCCLHLLQYPCLKFMCICSIIFFCFLFLGKQRRVAEYYKKQERLLEGFNEMDTMNETGFFPGSLTDVRYSFQLR